MMPRLRLAVAALAVLIAATLAAPAFAGKIETVVSPKGITAWLMHETATPLIALDFAMPGGAARDPAGKEGLAAYMAGLLDEGAGDYDSAAFAQRVEDRAIEMSFQASQDFLRGSLKMLRDDRDEAFAMMRLALTAPRFDAEPMDRVRNQILAGLRRELVSPGAVATRRFWSRAFPNHPYGRPANGTPDTVAALTRDDLKSAAGTLLTRAGLVVGVVGDIDAATLAPLLDRLFGDLPNVPAPAVPQVVPAGVGERIEAPVDVPQTTILDGGPGIPRADPDFMAGYIVNHILGGGSSSRLYREFRDRRGLAYSASSSLYWLQSTALFMASTATKSDSAAESATLLADEIKRMAESGPTADELAEAKAYLKGSQALALDTSPRIAALLVQYQVDRLGIDYLDRRAALIDAVTLEDARRAARRLYGGGVLSAIAGRAPAPAGTPPALAPAPAATPPR